MICNFKLEYIKKQYLALYFKSHDNKCYFISSKCKHIINKANRYRRKLL